MQDKIIAAIAAYLEKQIRPQFSGRTEYGSYEFKSRGVTSRELIPRFCNEIATEIAASIAPLVEVGEPDWEDAPEWAEWLASNNKGLSQWFEDKPIWDDDIQMWDASTEDGRYKFAGKLAKCKELKQRPK